MGRLSQKAQKAILRVYQIKHITDNGFKVYNALATEYMVAIAKNFYIGELKCKRKNINLKIIKQITSISELYKKQILKIRN